MSGNSLNPSGFKYFDAPSYYISRASRTKDPRVSEEDDEYGEKSCLDVCCDPDCECDKCVRCQDNGLLEPDSFSSTSSSYTDEEKVGRAGLGRLALYLCLLGEKSLFLAKLLEYAGSFELQ